MRKSKKKGEGQLKSFPFAKLFETSISQVLMTIDEDEETGKDKIVYRAEVEGVRMDTGMFFKGKNGFREVFDKIGQAEADKYAGFVQEEVNKMLGGGK